METELRDELKRFHEALAFVEDERQLYELQVKFIGKKGSITRLKSGVGKIPPEERKQFGKAFNQAKQEIESSLGNYRLRLKALRRNANLARTQDLTFLPQSAKFGSIHPITKTRQDLETIFLRMGFDVVDGPHVEDERFNFDKLNFPSGHPARDMQDTFVIESQDGESSLCLRSHTSPVQVRTMLDAQPPLRIIAPGTTFRRDDDGTHSPMFHQIEGLCVDKHITMADLKATLYHFVEEFFGAKLGVRFRPSYFPFVEPGAEFDVQCPFCYESNSSSNRGCSTCKNSGWIELGGSGMVHPYVFESVGYDPEVYTGWAFGFGIDRMAMLRYDIPDIRKLFAGDQRFLEQLSC